MNEQDYDALGSDSSPIGRGWKDYWRILEQDTSRQRDTRRAKKEARRQVHKKRRRNAKYQLRNWENEG